MARKPSTCALVCPIQAQQLWFPAYIQIVVLMGPRIVIIILSSTRLFMSFAHLEKSSSLLFSQHFESHVKPHLPLQSHLSSNLQSPRTQKAARLPRMVPSSIGQKPGEQAHSFISIEREANTGLRSPQRVVGKRNASPFSRGAISGPWRSGLSHFLTIHQHSSSTAPARFSSSGRLKCSFWINNSVQLWYLHLRVPEEQSVFKRKWEQACSRGALWWREKSCNSQKRIWMNETDFLWLMSPKH